MADTIIVKNNSSSATSIEDMGVELPGSGQRILSNIFDFTEICVSEDLKSLIANSTLVVNNGVADLGIDLALSFLKCKDTTIVGGIQYEDIRDALATRYVSSDGISSTTSSVYVNKVALTVGLGLDPGYYILNSTADFQAVNNNKQVGVRLHNVTDNISYAESLQQTNNNTNWFSFAGQDVVYLDGTVDKTFALQFVQLSATTCNIRFAHIIFWRVE